MSDSVDRVFVHALNTVKKIPRTGSARPPPADRLRLYGLYKQSMEGDVERVMDRPIGDGADVQMEREKWDAWYAQRNLSRTEAKRQYISTLIVTMHKYASPTPEAGELVSELEFVWDQIKSNPSSSDSSSPKQPLGGLAHQVPRSQASYQSLGGRMSRGYSNEMGGGDRERGRDSRLRVLSPVSQADEEFGRRHPGERDDEDDIDEEEEYQEARDEPYTEDENNDGDEIYDQHQALREAAEGGGRPGRTRGGRGHNPIHNTNSKWRRRVEQALTKMSTEVAAMREQMESRALSNRRKSSPWAWLKWIAWVAMRQVFWDLAVLGVALVVMRLRGDRRLEERLKRLWREARMRRARVRFLRSLQLLPILS
ncbi:hypothetical protein FQN54_008120 [Arachnomyces sp. PD_36]|nr:hypothetical protein FQN54_008120 [Arachnomyces sp. PD_36]